MAPIIKIPLFDLRLSSQAKKEVAAVLKRGWLTTGPAVTRLEKGIAKLTRVPFAAALNSGTSGLQATLAALGVGPGREVITSPLTFVATVQAIMAVGARPILADVDLDTMCLDPDEVERKIGGRTAVVMPVDMAGLPANYERLVPICESHKLPLISDAAHAMGATCRRKTIPQLADAAVYSFYSTKNITCGEGGMVVSRHQMLIDAVRTLARHGLTSNAHARNRSGDWQYDALGLGLKANMSDLHAAVGLGQLAVFSENQQRRRRLVERYRKNLGVLDDFLVLPSSPKGYQHAWHLFVIRLRLSRLKIDRTRLIELMARRGIQCGVHFQPIFELSFYRQALGLSENFFPNTAYLGRRVVTLPLYPHLKFSEVDQVCEAVASILKRHRR
ncbi:MAG: DegT/DnrJ/EryC1/StrS aminotransferase family protein [bacterium]